MLDIKFIRKNPKVIKEACKNKQVKVDIDKLLEVDKKRLEILRALEDMRAKKNKGSKEIVTAKSEKEKQKVILEMKELDKGNDRLNKTFKELDRKFNGLMLQVPNLPLEDVPIGKDESENIIQREVGKKTKFNFKTKDHLEIGESLDLIDIKRAVKVSGSRFSYLKGDLVLLEFALVRLALDTLTKEGFIPIIPPVLIKKESMKDMGYMEHSGVDDMFVLDKDNLVLVGTSEQSIGPMHMNEVFNAKQLPRRYVGFSTCFRREAGSYGKDTKGIMRLHQFNKVEMFSYTTPEKGDEEHEFLLSMEEKLMQALKLPYRVSKMCSGDLGGPAARKYDLEAWMPGQDKYREVTSASTTTDFQARRLNIRYRDGQKIKFVHMLNGTAFAERPLIAILENYQQEDGSVLIPKVLQPYTGFKRIG
ncbi:MAG: serine--tRNA ligase [Patescibacteria group bacterium]|nr:serine--tRNA ligase [Patescibacteria group bacterium]